MKGDAVINGVMARRGLYLVHRVRVMTQGRVVRVRAPVVHDTKVVESVKVIWWSNARGLDVPSDPEALRVDGWEWSERPLADYVIVKPYPYDEDHPEQEPEEIDETVAEAAALDHAEKGDMPRAAALFAFVGNEEAAELCNRTPPKWR